MGNIQAKFPQARSILDQQKWFPYLFIYFETVNLKLSQALLNKGGTQGCIFLPHFLFLFPPPTMMTFFPSLFSVKGKMEDYGPTNASFTNSILEKDLSRQN